MNCLNNKCKLSVIALLVILQNACGYINYLDKQKGDACTGIFSNVFALGTCKLLQDCPTILNNFKRGVYSHSICGYEYDKQIGCCPRLKPNGELYLADRNDFKIEFIDSRINVYDLEEGDNCSILDNNNSIPGVCKLISDCPTLLKNIINRVYNHTICGYRHELQIGCCPLNNQNGDLAALEYKYKEDAKKFNNGMVCKVDGTNENGVIKYLEDCPELQYSKTRLKPTYFNFCVSDICKDLVCCPPSNNNNRPQKVCTYVDNPIDEISLRLHQNSPCNIHELNLTGVIQNKCDFAERNPHLKSKLKNVCKHDVCRDWYCCPIEKAEERHCTKRSKVSPYVEFVGPKCIDSKTGRDGQCRHSANCHVKRTDLDECGSNCCEKFYCCPDEDISNQRIFELRCTEYKNHFFKKRIEIPLTFNKNLGCVDSNYKNDDVTVRQYPHTAQLGFFKSDRTISWECTGSLISEWFVITAGHCLIMNDGRSVKLVRLGSPNCREDFGVSELIPHPEHKDSSIYQDIGLIKLNRIVTFNHHIRPVCLAGGPELPKHIFTVKYDSNSPNALDNVKIEHVDHELLTYQECKSPYNTCSSDEFNVSTQICTVFKDLTRTDFSNLGGPLLSFHDDVDHTHNFYKIYGVQSSEKCDLSPKLQIFTKIFPTINWIEKIVWQQ